MYRFRLSVDTKDATSFVEIYVVKLWVVALTFSLGLEGFRKSVEAQEAQSWEMCSTPGRHGDMAWKLRTGAHP
jgi:hypothetical protein